ncbi:MAG: hypothetical protein GY943_28085 [Chloroflexi bacterium]|nr:hypothetical protein [Chloroflexota bacterium]
MNHKNPDQAQYIEKVAHTLCSYGLRTPALVALEAGQPLTFVGSQLLWVAQPALSLFMPSHRVSRLAQLLEEPSAVQALVDCLESERG